MSFSDLSEMANLSQSSLRNDLVIVLTDREYNTEHTVGICRGNFYRCHSLQCESTVNKLSSTDTCPVEAVSMVQKISRVDWASLKEVNRSPNLRGLNLLNDYCFFQLL